MIQSVNLILVKNAKQVLTSDFSTLYNKTPHDKLLAILNSVFEFAIRGGIRDKMCLLMVTLFSDIS